MNSDFTREVPPNWKAIAAVLDAAQTMENNGRGVSCVRSIAHYLRTNDVESANAVRQTDGDKIRSYPKLDKLITVFLGCRLHLRIGCTDSICKP